MLIIQRYFLFVLKLQDSPKTTKDTSEIWHTFDVFGFFINTKNPFESSYTATLRQKFKEKYFKHIFQNLQIITCDLFR